MEADLHKSGSITHTAKFTNVKGIKTRYYDLGQGEPMVLIHGDEWSGKGNANTWSLNLGGLAKNFHVYAPDKLGSGMTDNPKTDSGYTIQTVVRHMHDFITTMGLKQVHLVGQSRGAGIATRLALEYPGLAKTLVIVDSQTLAPEIGDFSERWWRLFSGLPKNNINEYIRQVWERMSYNIDHVTDEYVASCELMEMLPKSQEAKQKIDCFNPDTSYYTPKTSLNIVTKRWEESLLIQKEETLNWIKQGQLKIPTLVYWGANDPTAILEQGLALFDFIREYTDRSQMHIVNHAGHFHYREYPIEWNNVVTNFIKLS